MKWGLLAAVSAVTASVPAWAADAPPMDMAQRFGALESVRDIGLSPDGGKILYLTPGPDRATVVMVVDLASSASKPATVSDGGAGSRLQTCGWSANDRIVCDQYLIDRSGYAPIPYTRLFAVDSDGKNMKLLGQRNNDQAAGINQYDGDVLDWGVGDGTILLSRNYVPLRTQNSRFGSNKDGLGVDRVNTYSLQASTVEAPEKRAYAFMSDVHGHIRVMKVRPINGPGLFTGQTVYFYRKDGSSDWTRFSDVDANNNGGFVPRAVDGVCDCIYATLDKGGRNALYTVKMDGTMSAKLLVERPDVDVDGVITLGRRGRVIGAAYATDKRTTEYFDPAYKALAAALSKALPGLPFISFIDATADESKLLIFAGSDVDPGRYYLFDKPSKKLSEILLQRPPLEGMKLATVKAVTYKADDGTVVPAYLTLPPNGAAKGLPALVMPPGDFAARDERRFDWLAQYFAQRGYAVFQPNFRGAGGYGEQWFQQNGFKSWRLAIGDVVAAGKWLVSEGVADPRHLAIFGWGYGGYAALQSIAVDPDMFKAVVAIAPVTDLAMLKAEAQFYLERSIVARFVGDGPEVADGSPTHHAAEFKAPVLMFHGTEDALIRVTEAKEMDEKLRAAGKASTLVIYDGLDHQLLDPKARADMLAKSDAFLRASMGM